MYTSLSICSNAGMDCSQSQDGLPWLLEPIPESFCLAHIPIMPHSLCSIANFTSAVGLKLVKRFLRHVNNITTIKKKFYTCFIQISVVTVLNQHLFCFSIEKYLHVKLLSLDHGHILSYIHATHK